MNKKLFLALFALPLLASAQFVENFDASTSTPAGWTVINGGDPNTFIFGEGAPGSAFTQKNAAQINYSSSAAHDDYLVTPAIAVTANVNDRLTFWVKNQDPAYVENFDVKLSTGAATAADLNVVLLANAPAPSTWTKMSIDLSAYVGQTVYVGFHATSTNMFRLLFDDVVSDSPNNGLATPACPSLSTPASGSVNVDASNSVALTWTAPTGGGQVEYYELYLDKTANPTTKINNFSATTASVSGLDSGSTYYWKVVSVNSAGVSTGCSQVFSFTTKADAFSPYCSAGMLFSSGIEPITNVTLQELNNTSSAATTGNIPLEDFISKTATLEQGKTYTISFQGNTNGTFTNRFILFIDWDQNGKFVEAGEQYFGTTATKVELASSTGVDGKVATGTFTVPANAALGNTRMRIKKNFGTTAFYLSPCYSGGKELTATTGTGGYGQAEDYTVHVIPASLGVANVEKSTVSVYPNPVVDVLHVNADRKVTEVSVYSVDGKVVKTLSKVDSDIDMSNLSAGVYVVKVKTSAGEKSFKVIKK